MRIEVADVGAASQGTSSDLVMSGFSGLCCGFRLCGSQ